jgi:hypothetical protein
MPPSTFTILRQEDDGRWAEVEANVSASSRTVALRAYLTDENEGRRFVAVTAHAWQPREVGVESKPVLRWR